MFEKQKLIGKILGIWRLLFKFISFAAQLLLFFCLSLWFNVCTYILPLKRSAAVFAHVHFVSGQMAYIYIHIGCVYLLEMCIYALHSITTQKRINDMLLFWKVSPSCPETASIVEMLLILPFSALATDTQNTQTAYTITCRMSRCYRFGKSRLPSAIRQYMYIQYTQCNIVLPTLWDRERIFSRSFTLNMIAYRRISWSYSNYL